MRIYLACTVRGDRGGVSAGRVICARLQRDGHDVLTSHLLNDDVEIAEAQLTEEEVFRRDLDFGLRPSASWTCFRPAATSRTPAPCGIR